MAVMVCVCVCVCVCVAVMGCVCVCVCVCVCEFFPFAGRPWPSNVPLPPPCVQSYAQHAAPLGRAASNCLQTCSGHCTPQPSWYTSWTTVQLVVSDKVRLFTYIISEPGLKTVVCVCVSVCAFLSSTSNTFFFTPAFFLFVAPLALPYTRTTESPRSLILLSQTISSFPHGGGPALEAAPGEHHEWEALQG